MFVKICGTTTEEDALLSVAMGADAVGFVLAPSPRRVSVETSTDIIKRLPPEIVTIGVFHGDSRDKIVRAVSKARFRGVQLHGDASDEDISFIRNRVPVRVIRAVAAGSPEARHADAFGADFILFDAPKPGSGQVFDWDLMDLVPKGIRIIVAGGLDADNVTGAIKEMNPFGVDVVSGVESEPGKKDSRKLREFIKNAKAAAVEVPTYEPSGPPPFDWSRDT